MAAVADWLTVHTNKKKESQGSCTSLTNIQNFEYLELSVCSSLHFVGKNLNRTRQFGGKARPKIVSVIKKHQIFNLRI